MPTKNDPFEVLGLEPGASTEEVRKRYRELARRYHPDVNEGDSTAEWMFKQLNEAYEAIVTNTTEQGPQSPPKPPGPPAQREPPTPSSWTPPKPVDDSEPWVLITGVITAVAAGQIAGWLTEATGFAEELAVVLDSMSSGSTSPAHARTATVLATAITLAATMAARHKAWRDSDPGPWRPALQALEALAYTTAAATLGSVAVIMLTRYTAQ